MDRNLAEQRRGQSIENSALDLHLDIERIDNMTAIDTSQDALDFHFAALADRDFRDLTDDCAKGFVDREAAADAVRQRLAPISLLGELIEHGDKIGSSRSNARRNS